MTIEKYAAGRITEYSRTFAGCELKKEVGHQCPASLLRWHAQLAPQLLRQLKILLPAEGHVQDVEVFLRQPHTPKAIRTVRQVSAVHQVRTLGAVL
jgi:hypothetical protein